MPILRSIAVAIVLTSSASAATIVIDHGLAAGEPGVTFTVSPFDSGVVQDRPAGTAPATPTWAQYAGGPAESLTVREHSTLVIDGQAVLSSVAARDHAVLHVTRLEAEDLSADGDALVFIHDSDLPTLFLGGASATTFVSGAVGAILMDGDASLLLLDVDVGQSLFLTGGAQLEVRGGDLGVVGNPFAIELAPEQGAVIRIHGTAFAVDGVPVGYGALAATSGVLTGLTQNGGLVENAFRHDGAAIVLVPEPGTALTLLLGLGLLARRPGRTR